MDLRQRLDCIPKSLLDINTILAGYKLSKKMYNEYISQKCKLKRRIKTLPGTRFELSLYPLVRAHTVSAYHPGPSFAVLPPETTDPEGVWKYLHHLRCIKYGSLTSAAWLLYLAVLPAVCWFILNALEADYHRRRSDIHQRTQVNHRRSPPRVANHNDQVITARNPQNTTASPRLSASQRISHGQPSAHSRLGERVWVEKGSQAQYSHTPPPNPPREAMYANQEVDSTQNRRQIAHRLQLSDKRGVLPPVGDLDSSSQERRSVLHRIETPGTRALTPVPSEHAMVNKQAGGYSCPLIFLPNLFLPVSGATPPPEPPLSPLG
ncbi:hypothetical protein YC2023_113433 [Brassica napus]